MLEFPTWFDKMIPNICCPNCKSNIEKKYIAATGIRKSKKSKDTSFFIQYDCFECAYISIIEISKTSMKEYISDMYSMLFNNKKCNKSKITQEEFDNMKKFLGSCQSHEEFMIEIGVSKEEIESKAKKKEKKDKKNGDL